MKRSRFVKAAGPLGSRDLQLELDGSRGDPLFLQIARAITADIQRGRLRPGARLPGSRTLADSLRVHRNTVLAAYAELSAEGWIEASRASGTFVARSLPIMTPRPFVAPLAGVRGRVARPGFDLRGPMPRRDARIGGNVFAMGGGVPDLRLTPARELARAYGRVLRQNSRAVLSYADPEGHPRLRAALAAMLATMRGITADADDVLVTRGSQMAHDLVARTLVEPGDVVAVEALGYRYTWGAFERYGAKLVAIPIDEHGLDVGDLGRLVERTRIRAVCVTPHHQYPTTVTMSASRRVALLALAARHRFAIVEDDYDHEFHYEGRPVLPLASSDDRGTVVYVGSLSKILAPGVRIGYVVAARKLLERMAAHRVFVDRQGDHAVELAVAQLLEDGTVQRSARRARRIYQTRRDALGEELRRKLGEALSFKLPSGGMAIWGTVEPEVDPDRWVERALELEVVFRSGREYAFDGRARQNVRIGFAALDERELVEATRRLAIAFERAAGG